MRFRAGDFLLGDPPRSGKPVEVGSDGTQTLTENNQRYTTWNIAVTLKLPKSSIENHLQQLGFVITLMFGVHIS